MALRSRPPQGKCLTLDFAVLTVRLYYRDVARVTFAPGRLKTDVLFKPTPSDGRPWTRLDVRHS